MGNSGKSNGKCGETAKENSGKIKQWEIREKAIIFARKICRRFPSFLIAFAKIFPLLLPEFAIANLGKSNGKFRAKAMRKLEKRQDIFPVLSLYIQRCNHDRSATQNLTPISRYFKYIFSHFYPYFEQNGYKLAFKKKHPYFSHSKYTFTKLPLFYKSFIYFFFIKKQILKHITNKEKSSYGVNTQVGHTNIAIYMHSTEFYDSVKNTGARQPSSIVSRMRIESRREFFCLVNFQFTSESKTENCKQAPQGPEEKKATPFFFFFFSSTSSKTPFSPSLGKSSYGRIHKCFKFHFLPTLGITITRTGAPSKHKTYS